MNLKMQKLCCNDHLRLIGQLVAKWNGLEFRIRELLAALVPDPLTAHLLTADFQLATLISVTRAVARERQQMNERINVALRKKRARVKLYEASYEHIEYFLSGADLLREYRNHYVHGVMYGGQDDAVHIGRMTGRKRLSFSFQPVQASELESVNRKIGEFSDYGCALVHSISRNDSPRFAARPKWPKRPPAPQKLAIQWSVVGDALRASNELL